MRYDGVLYRPPSESQSLLVQVTRGCSYNRCTFCAMYQDVDFRLNPVEQVKADIAQGATYRFRRVFLCDGDALIAPQQYLVEVLSSIRETMPFAERVGIYGDTRSILKRKAEDLARLGEMGLGIIYHGIESGDDVTLKAVRKGATAKQTIEAGRRVRQAGILYSAIALLGIAGRERSLEHARETARVLNEIQPDFVGILTVMVLEGTTLWEQAERGEFVPPSRLGLVEELAELLRHLDLKKGLVTTRHASNYLSLRIVFPYQKQEALKYLEEILEKRDTTVLKPDFLRGL